MDLSNLKPRAGARRPRKRVGRGESSGQGKTAGKGHKGQNARSGGGVPAHFEGGQMPLMRRLPKFGFTNPNRVDYAEINLKKLDALKAGTTVDPMMLRKEKLVKSKKPIKVLANGEISKALTVKAHAFTKAAKEKIEKAGGTVEVLN